MEKRGHIGVCPLFRPPDLGAGWDDAAAMPPDLAGELVVLALI